MLGRTRSGDDFAAEIEAHIKLETERLQEQGLSPDDARAAARRAFGNVTHAQERFYESGRWLFWDHLSQDIRFALRVLRKSPGFTAVAVLTIALGVGATTAIFSVVNATLLHRLPYPHPEQLVSIEDDLRGVDARKVGLSQPEWQDLQHSGVFDPDNYTPGFTGEVVISDGLWRRSFGSDPRILDRTLRLDTDLYRIVGVMPPGFYAPGATAAERNTEVWAATSFFGPPLQSQPPRNGRNLPEAIARLNPD